MDLYVSSRVAEKAFISGKLLFVIAAIAIGVGIKNASPGAGLMGESAAAIQATLGQPIAKEKIPRPS